MQNLLFRFKQQYLSGLLRIPSLRIFSSIVPRLCASLLLASLFCFALPQPAYSQTNFDDEIVYIDRDGRLRILDITQSSDVLIDWASDETGFFDFALGDFTGDGEPEIAAIRGQGDAGQLVVYDPVVSPNTSIPTGRSANGVPWKLLHQQNLGYTPLIVGAGNLDDDETQDEILVGFEFSGGQSELLFLSIEGANELQGAGAIELDIGDDGPLRFDRTWDAVSIGQIDGSGPDEIVLTDSTFIPDTLQSTIAMYRIDELADDNPFFSRGNSFASWRKTAIGEINGNDLVDVVALRKVVDPASDIATVYFFEYDTATQSIRDNDDGCPDEPHIPQTCPDDVDSLHLRPRPARVFLADVNNNDEQEMFFLRSTISSARFFLINRGDDTIKDVDDTIIDASTRHFLRSRDLTINPNDNLWDTGAGGDFDGDGDDEIAIGRSDRIVTYIFRNEDFPIFRQDVVNNGNLQMKAANLDSLGFATGVEVIAETSGLQTDIMSGSSLTFAITARTFEQSLIASLDIPNLPSWLSVNNQAALPISGQVPFSITVTIDATSLEPGEYSFEAVASSTDPVVTNSPSERDITFTVTPAQIEVDTNQITHVVYPCSGFSSGMADETVSIDITGTPGITYTATITPAANWLSLDKSTGTVADTLSVKLSPSAAPVGALSPKAEILIQGDTRTGSATGSHSISALMLCAQNRLYGAMIP